MRCHRPLTDDTTDRQPSVWGNEAPYAREIWKLKWLRYTIVSQFALLYDGISHCSISSSNLKVFCLIIVNFGFALNNAIPSSIRVNAHTPNNHRIEVKRRAKMKWTRMHFLFKCDRHKRCGRIFSFLGVSLRRRIFLNFIFNLYLLKMVLQMRTQISSLWIAVFWFRFAFWRCAIGSSSSSVAGAASPTPAANVRNNQHRLRSAKGECGSSHCTCTGEKYKINSARALSECRRIFMNSFNLVCTHSATAIQRTHRWHTHTQSQY